MSHDAESAPSSRMADQIAGHVADALAAVAALTSMQDLDERGGAIVGKRSALAVMQRSLAGLSPEQRRDVGARLQEARRVVEEAVASRRAELLARARTQRLEADRLELGDVVVQRRAWPLTGGHAGLVSRTQAQLEDVFVAMGYEVADGPQVESDWYNFEALNIPPAHPSRVNIGAKVRTGKGLDRPGEVGERDSPIDDQSFDLVKDREVTCVGRVASKASTRCNGVDR